jgi:acetate kinase
MHLGGEQPAAVGHRVLHGGTRFAEAKLLDDAVLDHLQSLCLLAPLHQPHSLAAIRAVATVAPSLLQVACFDTAFHHDQPAVAQRFALPRELHDAGIRRYGFHGLSYDYIASALRERDPVLAHGRVIVAHLGSGCSLCAMRDGKSIDTTMGFTALDGLPMGTRCGALDPGVILYLMQHYQMDAAAIEDLIYRKAGLLGVSGISSDMRALRASSDPAAREAIALFVYRIVREVGSLVAALGGLDAIVFAGGIGENDAKTRAEVVQECQWLGVALDPEQNARGVGLISSAASQIAVWVVPTDEELLIARQTADVLAARPSSPPLCEIPD